MGDHPWREEERMGGETRLLCAVMLAAACCLVVAESGDGIVPEEGDAQNFAPALRPQVQGGGVGPDSLLRKRVLRAAQLKGYRAATAVSLRGGDAQQVEHAARQSAIEAGWNHLQQFVGERAREAASNAYYEALRRGATVEVATKSTYKAAQRSVRKDVLEAQSRTERAKAAAAKLKRK